MKKSKWKVLLKDGNEHIIESEHKGSCDNYKGLWFYNSVFNPQSITGQVDETVAEFAGGTWDHVIKVEE
jgi:hypothetical protein